MAVISGSYNIQHAGTCNLQMLTIEKSETLIIITFWYDGKYSFRCAGICNLRNAGKYDFWKADKHYF